MNNWIERHMIRTDPGRLSNHVECFADELANLGYTTFSIGEYLRSIAHFGFWITHEDIEIEEIDDDVVHSFATHHCECPGLPNRKGRTRRYVARIRRFVDFMRDKGVVPKPKDSSINEAPILVEFGDWLSNHRGLSVSTINRNVTLTGRMLPKLGCDPSKFTATTIRETVCDQARSNGRAQAKCIVTALRSFLKFLASQGRLLPELLGAVPTLPHWQLSSLPKYLPEEEVERLISSCDLSKSWGARDKAILLLLSRLGLRAGDIVDMQIEDIDWKNGRLRVSGKGRSEHQLPLPQEVGEALLSYLESARPEVPLQHVFLCSNAPWRPLSGSSVVSSIVAVALRRAGIDNPPSRGANLLRHSAATTMLRAGLDLEGVGALLRHRSVDTTAHYAKVDVATLEQLSQPWPGGESC